jgi:hypothetical protein
MTGVTGSVLTGILVLVAALVGFFVGSVAWSGLSGLFAGALAAVGIVTPVSVWIAVSPVAGLFTAGYAAQVVMD